MSLTPKQARFVEETTDGPTAEDYGLDRDPAHLIYHSFPKGNEGIGVL